MVNFINPTLAKSFPGCLVIHLLAVFQGEVSLWLSAVNSVSSLKVYGE